METCSKRNCLLFAVVSLILLTASGTACLADDVTIVTPRNTAINAYQSSEMLPEEITKTDLAYAKIIKDNQWQAVIKSSSSSQYNT